MNNKFVMSTSKSEICNIRIVALACSLVILGVMTVLGGVPIPHANAQSQTLTPTPNSPMASVPLGGADLMILIDQSASMWEKKPNVIPNDPNALRIDASQLLVERLGIDSLYFDGQRINRIAVMSFANSAIVPPDLNVTEIQPKTPTEWATTAEGLKRQIKARQSTDGTNFQDAFRRAFELFRGPMSVPPSGDTGPRQKGIILITDGCPYAVGKAAGGLRFIREEDWGAQTESLQYPNWKAYYQKWLQAYMAEMVNDFNVQLSQDYYLFVIGINDSGDDYWIQCGKTWETMVQLARKGSKEWHKVDAVKIQDIVYEITQTVLPHPNVELFNGAVPPYLDKLILTAFRRRFGTNILLYREYGNPNTLIRDGDPDVIRHFSIGLTEQWELRRPSPGTWGISKEATSDVTLWAEQIFIRTDMASSSPQPQPIGSKADVNYTLRDSDGSILTVDANYKPEYVANAQATIQLPDGTNLPQTLPAVRTAPGKYTIVGIPLNFAGVYTVTLVGTANLPRPDPSLSSQSPLAPREVFRDTGGKIVAYTVTSMSVALGMPRTNQVFGLHGGLLSGFALQPVPVQVSLSDPTGKPVDPTKIMKSNVNDAFVISLQDPDGKAERTPLRYDDTKGIFTGEIGTTLGGEGPYTVTLSTQAQMDPEYRLNIVNPQIPISRVDGILERPQFYVGAGGLILLAFGFLMWQFMTGMVGYMIFTVPGNSDTILSSISLNRRWRSITIGKRELSRYPILTGIKEIQVQLESPDEPGKRAIKFRMKTEDGEEYKSSLYEDQLPISITNEFDVAYKRDLGSME